MALRLRRGTDAERLLITPAQGELIYTTDTRKLYIGDGTTVGGRIVEGSGSPDLANLADVDVAGVLDGQLLAYNSSTQKWEAISAGAGDGVVEGSNYKINIVGVDSSVMIDTDTLQINAPIINGNVFGTLTGDVVGSVFSDDSTLIVDAINKTLTGDLITPINGRIEITNPGSVGDGLNGGPGEVNLEIYSNDNRSLLNLRRRTTDDLTGDVDAIYGVVSFGRDDVNGLLTTGLIFGRETSLYFGNSATGVFNSTSQFMVWKDHKLGVGLTTPTEAVDVNGNIKSTGSIQPGVYADDAARDAAITSPVAGMMVFNTTGAKFQGYNGTAWVDLN